MKRAEITGPNLPLDVVEKAVPPVPEKGFLIKTVCSGICHTDLHLIEDQVPLGGGKFWRHRDVLGEEGFKGVVPGHEILGDVLAVGSGVPADSGLSPGQRVLVYPWRGCRQCWLCDAGYSNMCMENKATTTDIGKGFPEGGYSSHIAVPEWQLAVKAPDNIPPEVACMLPCSALTTYNALEKVSVSVERALAGSRGEARVLVVGAGGLGVWATLLLKMIYSGRAVRVVVADTAEPRLAGCRAVGADQGLVWPVEASEDDLVQITTAAGGRVDAAVDLVGLPKTLRAAFYSLNNGGTLVPVGFAGGELNIAIPHVIGRSITIAGNRVGSMEQLRRVTALVSEHGLAAVPPTEIFPISDVNAALDKLRAGKVTGRAVLNFPA